jgi:predicted cytidylate kinase
MILTISGTPGSGKSTIGKMLAKKLGLKRYYMGQIFRDTAKKKDMDLATFLEHLKQNPKEEKEIDNFIIEIAKKEDDFIIEGRTAFCLLPQSIKIFIDVEPEVGANRIFKATQSQNDRNEQSYKSKDDVIVANDKRMKSDFKRYKALYGVDVYDRSLYDVLIDTSDVTPEEATDSILGMIKSLNTPQDT